MFIALENFVHRNGPMTNNGSHPANFALACFLEWSLDKPRASPFRHMQNKSKHHQHFNLNSYVNVTTWGGEYASTTSTSTNSNIIPCNCHVELSALCSQELLDNVSLVLSVRSSFPISLHKSRITCCSHLSRCPLASPTSLCVWISRYLVHAPAGHQ